MRKEAIAAVVAILVVASLGIGYLSGSNGRGTQTITSTSTSISTSTTTFTSTMIAPFFPGAAATAIDSNGSTGVDLVLALNATTLKVGQRLNVNVSLFNTLPGVNSVPTSRTWLFQGVPVAFYPACYISLGGDTPVRVVVLMGNYTLQELPAVANVPFFVNCAGLAEIDHLVFQPHSSRANLTEFYPDANHANATLGPFQLSLGFATSGYWDLLNNSRELNPPVISEHPLFSPTATAFLPGVYTVAVSDEWGQAAALHFTVKG